MGLPLVRFNLKYYTRLIRKEIVDIESLQNINIFVSLLEEFLFNLNEVHTSSDEVFMFFL